MKTKTQLLKDLQLGCKLKMLSMYGNTNAELCGVIREITRITSNSFALRLPEGHKNAGRNSFVSLPCAALIEYDNNTFKLFDYIIENNEETDKKELCLEYEFVN